jgi:hypothetical protein
VALPDVPIAFHKAARHGHEQREGQVSRCLREHIGGVGDDDAAARAGGHIDVVVSDPYISDHAQARRLPQQFFADPHAGGHQALDLAASIRQLNGLKRQIFWIHLPIASRRDTLDCLRRQRPGNEYLGKAQLFHLGSADPARRGRHLSC